MRKGPSLTKDPTRRPKPPAPRGRRRAAALADESGGASGFALVDQVYVAIRDAIRERSLVPGQRLVERELAEWLGVSRTPVREALRLLEAHGLASTLAGSGLVVTSLSRSEISELYFTWEELEAITARRAAKFATDFEIGALQALHAQWDVSASPETLSNINKQFHAALRYAAHNVFLLRALSTVHDSVSLLGTTTYTVPGRTAEIGDEHAAIVDAIAARDGERAEAAMRAHIQRNGQLRMTLLMSIDESAATPRHTHGPLGRG